MCLLCDLDTSFDDRVVLTAQKRRPDRRTPKFLACCGLLWGCGCCGSRRGAARTARGAGFAFLAKLLLALEIFVEADGQILPDHVLNAKAPLAPGAQLFVPGANLLIAL